MKKKPDVQQNAALFSYFVCWINVGQLFSRTFSLIVFWHIFRALCWCKRKEIIRIPWLLQPNLFDMNTLEYNCHMSIIQYWIILLMNRHTLSLICKYTISRAFPFWSIVLSGCRFVYSISNLEYDSILLLFFLLFFMLYSCICCTDFLLTYHSKSCTP